MIRKYTSLFFLAFSMAFAMTAATSCNPESTNPLEICGNGIDDDDDGYTDEADTDCQEQDCGDGIDNDNDGFIDCDDTDCSSQPGC